MSDRSPDGLRVQRTGRAAAHPSFLCNRARVLLLPGERHAAASAGLGDGAAARRRLGDAPSSHALSPGVPVGVRPPLFGGSCRVPSCLREDGTEGGSLLYGYHPYHVADCTARRQPSVHRGDKQEPAHRRGRPRPAFGGDRGQRPAVPCRLLYPETFYRSLRHEGPHVGAGGARCRGGGPCNLYQPHRGYDDEMGRRLLVGVRCRADRHGVRLLSVRGVRHCGRRTGGPPQGRRSRTGLFEAAHRAAA